VYLLTTEIKENGKDKIRYSHDFMKVKLHSSSFENNKGSKMQKNNDWRKFSFNISRLNINR